MQMRLRPLRCSLPRAGACRAAMPRGARQVPGGEGAVPVKIIPLGGLGEVGKNITLYECQGDMLLVDCGIVFPDSDMYGIDLGYRFSYVVENKERIKGVLITHGHEEPYWRAAVPSEKGVAARVCHRGSPLALSKISWHGLLRSTKLVDK